MPGEAWNIMSLCSCHRLLAITAFLPSKSALQANFRGLEHHPVARPQLKSSTPRVKYRSDLRVKEKTIVFFLWRGVFSLYMPFNGRPQSTHHTRVWPFPVCLSRKASWQCARTLVTQIGMTNQGLKDQGLLSVKKLRVNIHYPATAR
jgi:hypothetical protein